MSRSFSPIPVYSIALLSASAIAYEILLVRLFSIIQWHHYAYMVISLALVGYGASGTFLALFRQTLMRRFELALIVNITLFALSTVVCFLIAQLVPFNPDEMGFDYLQWLNLITMYLVLAVPFFFAANAIGLSLAYSRSRLSRVYAADLIGAGLGSLLIIALLFMLLPLSSLQVLAVLGLLSAWVAAWETRFHHRYVAFVTLVLISIIAISGSWMDLKPSSYKDLQQTLRIPGTSVVAQHSSPLGFISVVESDKVPFRHAPGLSLNFPANIPHQLGVFIDGNGPLAINQAANAEDLEYMQHMTTALPYAIRDYERVLIPASGTGLDVRQAMLLSNADITAIEINPQIITLVRKDYGEFSGNVYNNDRVKVINQELRGFLQHTSEQYDLLQLPLMGGFVVTSTGLQALSESYLYNKESISLYLQHLTPGGLLAINRWVRVPPRDMLKLLATVITVLEEQGHKNIDRRIALVRSWQTSALLIKNGIFTAEERDAIRNFSQQHSFDLAYLSDMRADEANQNNRLAQPYYYQAAVKLLGPERQQFLDGYKFNLQPSTNDQPYFHHFFRWQSLAEIIQLHGKGGVPLIDSGYLVILATLLQAVLVSAVLIILPLVYLRSRVTNSHQGNETIRIFIYFGALGLGFLLIEIAFIQKLTLFLHHPVYAVAVSLAAFLLFAGIGSQWSQRISMKIGKRPVVISAGMVIALSLLYLLSLDGLFALLIGLPEVMRILVAVTLIAPLAFFLGMPFPLGLTYLSEHAPEWVPWAWGINGCASVISAILATLIAIHFGFNTVILVAAGLYLVVILSYPRVQSKRVQP